MVILIGNRPTAITQETPELTTFSNFMLTPKGAQTESAYHYTLPPTVVENQPGDFIYRLYLDKQAGMHPSPVEVNITLPEGRTLVTANPKPESISNGNLHFQVDLAHEINFTVSYR